MTNITEKWAVESKQFGELMARMHGDGGHYLAEHGAVKAADDAMAKWYAMMQKVELLEKQLLEQRNRVSRIAMELMK